MISIVYSISSVTAVLIEGFAANPKLEFQHAKTEESHSLRTEMRADVGCRGKRCKYNWSRNMYKGGGTRPKPSRASPYGPNTNDNINYNNQQVEINCLEDNYGGPPKYFPNSNDCSTFYSCNFGRPILTHCPRGFYFNPSKGYCEKYTPNGWCLNHAFKPGSGAIYEE